MSSLGSFAWGAFWGAVVFTAVGGLTAMFVLLERKVSGHIQLRLGPMETGPRGMMQTVADMIKLVVKEDVHPAQADSLAFRVGPLLVLVPAVLSFVVIPFGAPLIIRDLNVGVLYFLAVPGATVVGLLLSGWASYDNYSFLGGLRSSAQFISYEIPRTLAVVTVVMLSGSLSTQALIDGQKAYPYILVLPVSFFIYLVTSLAEVNRIPFDIPEAESELVAGYHTEYSGFRWAMFFMGEYGALFSAAAFGALAFLGAGNGPLLPPVVWFLIKAMIIVLLYMLLRFTLPRFRSDQLMRLAWRVFIPLSLANLLLAVLVMRALGA